MFRRLPLLILVVALLAFVALPALTQDDLVVGVVLVGPN